MPKTTPHAVKPRLVRRLLIWLTTLIVLPAFFFSVINLLIGQSWIADTFVHFRIQYLVIGLLGLTLTVWHRKTLLAILSAVVLACNVGPVMTYFAVPGIAQAHAGTTGSQAGENYETFRIASANIYARNKSFDQVADWIKRESPDFVVLIEARRPWEMAMKKRLTDYPYQKLVVRQYRSGKLLLSKLPFEKFDVLDQVGERSKTPIVTIARNNARVRIAALHTNWPMRPAWAADRNNELERIAQTARENAPPLVALGDLNITPFSLHFQKMERDGNLRRASAGRGWLHSWPTFFMPAGIQIDHIMITPSIQVADYKTGAGINSDHKWVLADLQVPVKK